MAIDQCTECKDIYAENCFCFRGDSGRGVKDLEERDKTTFVGVCLGVVKYTAWVR